MKQKFLFKCHCSIYKVWTSKSNSRVLFLGGFFLYFLVGVGFGQKNTFYRPALTFYINFLRNALKLQEKIHMKELTFFLEVST